MSDSNKKVFVYMYDLSQGLAKQFSEQLTGVKFEGIWHSSVVVFGYEYFYSGGIQRLKPEFTPFGKPTKKVDLGKTEIPQEVFEQYLNGLRLEKFKMQNYDLFKNNCNHFTEEATQLLTSKSIPDEVKGLPDEFLKTDIGKKMKPMIDALMGGVLNFTGGGDVSSNSGGESSSSGGSSSSSSSSLGQGGLGMDNPQLMQSMMQNPQIQQLMSNPEVLSGMMQSPLFQQQMQNNPMLQQMTQSNPMVGQMLQNPQMMSQMMNNPMVQQMMNNPQLMQQMMNGGMGNMGSMFGGSGGGGSGGGGSGGGMGHMGSMFGGGNQGNTQGGTQPSLLLVFKDDKEIYRYNKAKVPSVIKKLLGTAKSEKITLTEEDKKTIENLKNFLLQKKSKKDISLITKNTFIILKKFIKDVPEEKIFPSLDLFRLLILTTKNCQTAIEMKDGPLQAVLDLLPKWSKLSMPTQLMILRVFCNLFNPNLNVKVGPLYIILNSKIFEAVAEIVTSSLTSRLEGLRLTACSLSANISLFVSKNGNDEETQILCSMVEFLNSEKSEPVLHRMLLTIYRLLSDNKSGVELVQTLDVNFKRIKKKIKGQETSVLLDTIEKILK